MDFDVDAVVCFVDGSEPVWRSAFDRTFAEEKLEGRLPACEESYTPNRYTDHGELEICLFGIRKFMPWVRRIWLVVSNPEQVPGYVRRYDVDVVLHRQIIPEEHLPQFNSSAIELFLHKIPGLSEHWIYLNDDMFMLKPIGKDHFFDEDGTPLNQFKRFRLNARHLKAAYFQSFRNAYYTALNAVGKMEKYADGSIDMLQHHAKALRQSSCEELWRRQRGVLERSITPFRSEKSINGYVFQLFDWYSGKSRRRTKEQERKNPMSKHVDFSSSFIVCNDDRSLDVDAFKTIREKIGMSND